MMLRPRARPIIGGRPYFGRDSLAVSCPICDAAIGMHCVLWRMVNGVRDSVLRTLNRPHAERVRLWKAKIRPDVFTAGTQSPGLTTPPSAPPAQLPDCGPRFGDQTC